MNLEALVVTTEHRDLSATTRGFGSPRAVAGERLLGRSQALRRGLREAEAKLGAGKNSVKGRLQISMSSDLGRHTLPLSKEFRARFPGISLRLRLIGCLVNIYREPHPRTYRGVPASPRELDGHNCLCVKLDETVNGHWRLRERDHEIEVATHRATACRRFRGDAALGVGGPGHLTTARIVVHEELASDRLRLLCLD